MLKWGSLIGIVVQNSSLILVACVSRSLPGPPYLGSVAVFLTEVLKAALILIFGLITSGLTLYKELMNLCVSEPKLTLFFAAPALCYNLLNNLWYVAVAKLDPVTISVATQGKIVFAAIFSVLLLGRRLGPVRWAAVFFLALGLGTLQSPNTPNPTLDPNPNPNPNPDPYPYPSNLIPSLNPNFSPNVNPNSNPNLDLKLTPNLSLNPNPTLNLNPSPHLNPSPMMGAGSERAVGMVAMVCVCCLSGLAGVLTELLLKRHRTLASSLAHRPKSKPNPTPHPHPNPNSNPHPNADPSPHLSPDHSPDRSPKPSPNPSPSPSPNPSPSPSPNHSPDPSPDPSPSPSLWVQNLIMSVFSLPIAGVSMLVADGHILVSAGPLVGFNRWLVATIGLGAVGGVLTSVALKYADTLLKSFAVGVSIALSCLLSNQLLLVPLSARTLIGIAIVAAASTLYYYAPNLDAAVAGVGGVGGVGLRLGADRAARAHARADEARAEHMPLCAESAGAHADEARSEHVPLCASPASHPGVSGREGGEALPCSRPLDRYKLPSELGYR